MQYVKEESVQLLCLVQEHITEIIALSFIMQLYHRWYSPYIIYDCIYFTEHFLETSFSSEYDVQKIIK